MNERYNIGHLIENAIFTQLWKKIQSGDSLEFWRTQTKSEIDFVFTKLVAASFTNLKHARGVAKLLRIRQNHGRQNNLKIQNH